MYRTNGTLYVSEFVMLLIYAYYLDLQLLSTGMAQAWLVGDFVQFITRHWQVCREEALDELVMHTV